ncbi:heterokaryon incompatibility protein-domain-containing protein [Colletotrichum cereale]|nr:heterokaryon incompatibility protein-domain-containing protein [Colletotrichum cereale]
MDSAARTNLVALGGANLCDGCANVILDDSNDEFVEGNALHGTHVTLRHKNEGKSNIVSLRPACHWKDTLPELPGLADSARAGCGLCEFVREHVLKRGIGHCGDVRINAGYIWGADRDMFGSTVNDEGLVFWRCEVYKPCPREFLAALTFNIETSSDELADWLRIDDKRSHWPLSPENVAWINSEWSRCQAECGHIKQTTSFLPTRLVDVGPTDQDDPRLILSETITRRAAANSSAVEYVALSYCWGPKEDADRQLKTTPATLSAHFEKVPFESMTPVVRDTVVVCRALGIRYLWVDALCIIQGDPDDWNNKSLSMGRVYYCSALTICPLASTSCLQGYLGLRPPGYDVEFQSTKQNSVRGTYTLYPSSDDRVSFWNQSPLMIDLGQAVWEKRGWTYQENMLSNRLLFFGPGLWHFSCENETVSENSYFETGSVVHGSLRALVAMAQDPEPEDPGEASRRVRDAYARWDETLTIQTREWSYREDLLPGIAGLAEECARITNDTYLAGLWSRDLQYELIWEVANPEIGDLDASLRQKRQPCPYVAPSWSWASQTRQFELLPSRRYFLDGSHLPEEPAETQKIMSLSETLPCHVCSEFVLVRHAMDLQWRSQFGRLNSGSHIRLLAKLAAFPSDVVIEPRTTEHPPFGYFLDGSGLCLFDWTVESTLIQPPGKMQLLLISSCCFRTNNWAKLQWLAGLRNTLEKTYQFPTPPKVLTDEDYQGMDDCSFCKDVTSPKTAWGLVVHPADRPDTFYRVGIFLLFSEDPMLGVFSAVGRREVDLV